MQNEAIKAHYKSKDITGLRYNRLTAINLESRKNGREYWLFSCLCGNKKIILKSNVTRGLTKSCGCLDAEKQKEKSSLKFSGTPEYRSWRAMRQRCIDKRYTFYANYGGRGIKVCDRWLTSFENFLTDMGKRPEGTTLNRIDNEKGYSPSNCEWSSWEAQQNNRRNNKKVFYKGELFTISRLARVLNISHETLRKRIGRGEPESNWHLKRINNAMQQAAIAWITDFSNNLEGV